MTAARVVAPKRPSNSHWDHVAWSESDPNTPGVMPTEYNELAKRMVLSKAGNDAANLLAMLGLGEVNA